MINRKEYVPVTDECWQNLASAIVLNAVDRYRKLRRRQRHGRYLTECEEAEFKEIESFFVSEWFSFLTDIDGYALLQTLRFEVEYIRTGFII